MQDVKPGEERLRARARRLLKKGYFRINPSLPMSLRGGTTKQSIIARKTFPARGSDGLPRRYAPPGFALRATTRHGAVTIIYLILLLHHSNIALLPFFFGNLVPAMQGIFESTFQHRFSGIYTTFIHFKGSINAIKRSIPQHIYLD